MKKQRRLVLSVIIVTAVYFLGLYIGIQAMLYYSFKSRKDELVEFSIKMAQIYQENPDYSLSDTNVVGNVYLFNENRDVIRFYEQSTGDSTNVNAIPDEYLDEIFNGITVGRPFIRIGDRDQFVKIFHVAGTPLIEDGRITGGVLVFSHQIHFSDSLMVFAIYFTVFYFVLASVVLIMLNKTYQLDEMKQAYVANVTHSLKTPVASVKALAETLYDGVEPDVEVQKQYLSMILQQTDIQMEMIQNILDLSRLQEEHGKLRMKALSPKAVFSSTIEKYAVICARRELEFEVGDGFEELPLLYTNARAASLILDSLLSNAVKFTDKSGRILVDASIEKKKAVIAVSDTGMGISEDMLPRIYERFVRGSNASRTGGSGLGLAITREYCKSIRGKIWARSRVGEGTQMYFTVRIK